MSKRTITTAEARALQIIFRAEERKAIAALVGNCDLLFAMEDLAASGILAKGREPHNGSTSVVFRPGDGFWSDEIFLAAAGLT